MIGSFHLSTEPLDSKCAGRVGYLRVDIPSRWVPDHQAQRLGAMEGFVNQYTSTQAFKRSNESPSDTPDGG